MIVKLHSSEVHADTIRSLIREQRSDGCGQLTVEFIDKNVLVDLYLGETTTEPPTYRACKLLVDAVRKLERPRGTAHHHWADLVSSIDGGVKIAFESVTDISDIRNG